MSGSRTRRQFSAEQKAQVARRHWSGKTPVSGLADELKVQPSLIHLWVNNTSIRPSGPSTGQAVGLRGWRRPGTRSSTSSNRSWS